MRPSLDLLDVRILTCLDEDGPRNVSVISRKLGVPYETVRKRLERLVSRFFVTFPMSVYHTYIGLKKAFVFADAVSGHEDTLYDCMKANDFWIYVGQYYGRCEGCYGIYTVPVDHLEQFGKFVHELGATHVVRNVRLLWSTCLHSVNATLNWFDPDSCRWIFDWEAWMEEIPNEGTELPPTLVEPEEFPIKADDIDIVVLAKLEADYTRRMKDVAEILGMTPEAVGYHFKEHILKRGLIEKSQVFFRRFDEATSDFYVFMLRFQSEEKTARFASSLLDKPFVYGVGKIIGENGLIVHVCLPRREFRRFVRSLSELIKRGVLEAYEYLIEDYDKKQAQTISYEYFKDGTWAYDHKGHIENLTKIVEETKGQAPSR